MNSIKVMLPILYLLTCYLFLLTFFWGYCWNWGIQIPLLQYLFQPLCSLESEESRYPNNIDVLVSERYNPIAGHPLPSNNQIFYYTHETYNLYDFRTHIHREVTLPHYIQSIPDYITDQWVLIEVRKSPTSVLVEGMALLNLESEQQVILTDIKVGLNLADGIPTELHNLLRQSQKIYVHNGLIIATPSDIGEPSVEHYIIDGFRVDPAYKNSTRITENLQALGIESINLDTTTSHDGRFYYDPSFTATIFEQGTNRKIAVVH